MKQNSYNPKMLDICQAMKMFDCQVDDYEYKSEKEYLFISNLLFQNSLRLLPLKKNKEMKECYDILEKNILIGNKMYIIKSNQKDIRFYVF